MTHDLSLGELQALCIKAARGAGRAVGVAEDAGRAVRWLQARDQDGAGALVALLQDTDGRATRDLAPQVPDLTPVGGVICPLALGGYLSDMGDLPEGAMGPVCAPLLLLPFLADISPHGVDLVPGAAPGVVSVSARAQAMPAEETRAHVSDDVMEALLAFAARTYAPATEQSRASGAGAGLSDND